MIVIGVRSSRSVVVFEINCYQYFSKYIQLDANTNFFGSQYDVVSDLMHNAVTMCYQNSDASLDAPKEFIDS